MVADSEVVKVLVEILSVSGHWVTGCSSRGLGVCPHAWVALILPSWFCLARSQEGTHALARLSRSWQGPV